MFIKLQAFVRRSRAHGRLFATCPRTRPNSIPSRWCLARSRSSCARLPNGQFRVCAEPFAVSCRASLLKNVPTASGMRAMLLYDRETLLVPLFDLKFLYEFAA